MTKEKMEKIGLLPMPGIEPGPAGWKPAILAIRPHGINMFPPGIEPGTFCVLGRCDNHYTTETQALGCLELVDLTLPRQALGFWQ